MIPTPDLGAFGCKRENLNKTKKKKYVSSFLMLKL